MLKDFDFGSLFGDAGQYAGDYMPDYGLGVGPESGSFIGPDGTDPNGLSATEYDGLLQQAGSGLDANGEYNFGDGGGGGGSSLASIARQLGLSNGSGMGGLLGGLLPMLASIYGGVQSRNATQDASRQMQEAVTRANDGSGTLIGSAQANFTPYIQGGQAALGKLQAMQPSNLASHFKPIGSGRGLNLAQIVKG